MSTIQVVSIGVVGPTGPGAVDPGAVITSRGDFIIGNSSAVPARLPIGTTGKYIRTNGTDPSWQVIPAADLPAAIDAAKISAGSVSNTEFDYLNGVTSAIQTQLDAKSATTHAHTSDTTRGVYIDQSASSSASTDNTASTTVWANALVSAITLPTGTWKGHLIGGLGLKHSAAGTVVMRVTIDDADSGSRSYVTSSSLYMPVMDTDEVSGCSGATNIRVQFHSTTAGTTYAINPWWFLVAERTA